MKSSLKKITLAVLPLVALLLTTPSLALAKRNKHCNRGDYYSRYDDNYYRRYDRNQYYGRYDDRYYDNYYRRPSRSRYYDPSYSSPYYGNPYGNPYSYPSSAGTFPWWNLLLPRY
jgi:hypothetical protein